MRIWHKDLIHYLPDKQLTGQWRECCLIAKLLSEQGTPNHLLVNRVCKYPMSHFYSYGKLVYRELKLRGGRQNLFTLILHLGKPQEIVDMEEIPKEDIFPHWHNERYYWQCYFNLQEKYDCGGIKPDEWYKVTLSLNSSVLNNELIYRIGKTIYL